MNEFYGWAIVIGTLSGVVLGLSTFNPLQRECAPIEQPGYGRSPTNLRLRTSDRLL